MDENGLLALESVKALIQVFDALDEPWGIKDAHSRHIYMNKAARLYTSTPFKFDIEGKLDAEFSADWSELADDLIEHDRLTEQSGRRVAVIETHYWNGHDFITPYVSEKIPIYDEQRNCIGTVWNARKLDNLSPINYIRRQKPAVLKTEPPTDLFTPAELLILFFSLQRYSSKEVARQLKLSPKKVENRLRAHPIRLFYLPFCPWAVLTILTYCVYAPVVPRCPWTNYLQQYTPTEIGSKHDVSKNQHSLPVTIY